MLARGDAAELIDLIKELYDASPANRDFLHARFVANPDDESVLKPYLKRWKRGQVSNQRDLTLYLLK